MKKKIIIAVSFVILAVIGGGIFAYLQARESADRQNAIEAERIADTPIETLKRPRKAPVNPVINETTGAKKGTYVDYTPSAIADANDTRLLFFHAPWCPQCRMIDGDIEHDGVPDGVTVIKVDYDSNQILRQRYGVTLQTTFVKIDADGNLIEKYVAYNQPTFASVKEKLL